MKTSKKSNKYLLYLIPFILAMSLCLQFAIKPSTFLTNWSYCETSIIALCLGLCNYLPFAYRVLKTKDTKSFSILTLECNCTTGCLGLIIMLSGFSFSLLNTHTHGLSNAELYMRWIPDIIASLVGLSAALLVLFKKWSNKSSDTRVIRQKYNAIIWILIVFFVIAIIAISTVLYARIHYWKPTSSHGWKWLYIITAISACIAIVATIPTVVRVILTKHTYSISLYSKVSLFLAMIIWTLLDIQTLQKQHLSNYWIQLMSDGLVFLWTTIILFYKISNILLARKRNITEKELYN